MTDKEPWNWRDNQIVGEQVLAGEWEQETRPMIYTFGYLGQSFTTLQAWLVANDGWLVDIRLVPKSRVKGWGDKALMKTLGNSYCWVWELGDRNYKGGPIEIAQMKTGLYYVEDWAAHQTLVLMCACRSAQDCHRTVVAEELRRRGHAVEELRLGEVGA